MTPLLGNRHDHGNHFVPKSFEERPRVIPQVRTSHAIHY